MIDLPKTRAALETAILDVLFVEGLGYEETVARLRALSAALGQAQTGLFVNEAGQHVRGIWLPADATADEVTK